MGVKFVRLNYKLANIADRGVTILLDLNSWISLKMLRNKRVKVVLRAQLLETVEGSWEVVSLRKHPFRAEERLRLSDKNSILMTWNLSGIRSEELIGRRSSYIVLAIVYEWQTKGHKGQM